MAASTCKPYNAPALDKGLDILEFLSWQRSPRSQAEIATGLGRVINEIYRMLVALEARGYVRRGETSGKYQLSLKLYYLSHSHSPLDQLTQAARVPMQDLANELRQSCHINRFAKAGGRRGSTAEDDVRNRRPHGTVACRLKGAACSGPVSAARSD